MRTELTERERAHSSDVSLPVIYLVPLDMVNWLGELWGLFVSQPFGIETEARRGERVCDPPLLENFAESCGPLLLQTTFHPPQCKK